MTGNIRIAVSIFHPSGALLDFDAMAINISPLWGFNSMANVEHITASLELNLFSILKLL